MNPLPIPTRPFKAYLFDCDGTIADTMAIHFEAWNAALKPWNFQFSEELFQTWAGITIPKTVELISTKFNVTLPIDEVVERREHEYGKRLINIKPIECVLAHIHLQYGKIPFAVVSGGQRAAVIHTLNCVKLLSFFDTVVGAEDYENPKPHPEPYLTAAKRLGVNPNDCLVFEDAELGIESAKAAGMEWVRVPLNTQA